MENSNEKWQMFVGDWCPLTTEDKVMFKDALAKGENVCIAICENKNNKIAPHETYVNICKEYAENIYLMKNVKVIIVPNVGSVFFKK